VSSFKESHLISKDHRPLMLEPAGANRDLSEFVAIHKQEIDARLVEHGALLFRGFDIDSIVDFERASAKISSDALEYTYRSTPRTAVGKGVFTTTEYPADQEIALHCENAYQRTWPLKIAFCCLVAPESGGQTQIADVRQVTASLDPALLERFERLGVRYVRHYRPYVDISWEVVFQTSDRDELASFCARNDIEHDWLDSNTLRTVQTNQGLATHPITGERVFFNQAHLFHITNLQAEVADSLRRMYGDRVPRNTFFGDGSEFSASDLQAIRDAFIAAEMCFPWQVGDVMLLDNMQMAHGRKPFIGNRKVVASLLDAHTISAGDLKAILDSRSALSPQ
jgi:alpha-ketoglutarate-dependent taurine dioxygenase